MTRVAILFLSLLVSLTSLSQDSCAKTLVTTKVSGRVLASKYLLTALKQSTHPAQIEFIKTMIDRQIKG